MSTEWILILASSVVVLSYLFSILSKYIRIPSVLLLLFTGICLRLLAIHYEWSITIPRQLVEITGSIGLIMIVLEAGLDLKLGRNKVKIIRSAFVSALVILLLSVAGVATVLYVWLHEPLNKCLAYAVPLSIMSSSIVIPSLHQLTQQKKEFLVYEASFSDIIGIILFDLIAGGEGFSVHVTFLFVTHILLASVFSLLFSLLLFALLTKTKMNIRFFLIFALLIMLYEGGKMLDLPSLLIIMVFGLMARNWNLISRPPLSKWIPLESVDSTNNLLHSLTAESSFLIRTFFFILFGFTIDVDSIFAPQVMLIGSVIVGVLLLSRFLYLRFFLKEQVYPEVFFIPRGLITILLFYKIPVILRFDNFNEGILFFMVLATGLIMMIGMIFYKKKTSQIVEDEMLDN